MRTIYIEANIEKDTYLKNQKRIKVLPDPIFIGEAASKNYVDKKFNDPSILKNTAPVDFNARNLNNVHPLKVNTIPALEEQLTPKIYVDKNISDGLD